MPESLTDKAVDTVKATADKAADTAVDMAKSGGNMLMKVLPLFLLGIVGLFLWEQCGVEVKNTGEKMIDVAEAAGDAANASVDAAGNAVNSTVDAGGNAITDLGDFFKRKLTNGMELNIPEFGIESKLLNFLDDSKLAITKDA